MFKDGKTWSSAGLLITRISYRIQNIFRETSKQCTSNVAVAHIWDQKRFGEKRKVKKYGEKGKMSKKYRYFIN